MSDRTPRPGIIALFNCIRQARIEQRNAEDFVNAGGFKFASDKDLVRLMGAAALAQDAVIQYVRGKLER